MKNRFHKFRSMVWLLSIYFLILVMQSLKAPAQVNNNSLVILSKPLNTGWTWFSFNVEGADMTVSNILKNLKAKNGDYIKSQSLSSTYYEGYGWFGELQNLNPKEMYKIKLTQGDTLKLSGYAVDPEANIIDLKLGWNWIGFLAQKPCALNDALLSISPKDMDYIKNQTLSSTYYKGSGWFGELVTTEPMDGFMLKTSHPGILDYTLVLFQGYRVATNAVNLGESYWLRGTGVPTDLYVPMFQNALPGKSHNGYFQALTCGDFNNDGWLDIFDAGGSFQGPVVGFSFLVWDPITKKFDDKNLFNDKSFLYFGGNKNKAVPVFLNSDDFIDVVIFDNGDEGIADSPNEPIRVVLSDGKGGYDLKEIETNENDTFLINGSTWKFGNKKEGGDVGDLNGDGVPDLVITANSITYIYWGISEFPFFTKQGRAIICADDVNWGSISDNGFGERAPLCSGGAFNTQICDFNKDGENDILLCCGEDPNSNLFPIGQRILINQGNGRFNNSGVIQLPYFPGNGYVLQDYLVDDLNDDGLNDLIALSTKTYSDFTIYAYIQKENQSFEIDKNWFKFKSSEMIVKSGSRSLIYFDYDNDGLKDVGYTYTGAGNVFMADINNQPLKEKTIFKRQGNQFVEQDFYQFDSFAKSVAKRIN